MSEQISEQSKEIIPLSGVITERKHHFPVRVYFSDTDAGGIAYHGSYLDFAEHARTELLRLIGGEQNEVIKESKAVYVVKSIQIDYMIPAFLDDQLMVETSMTKCERFSLIFLQEVKRGDQTLAKLLVKIAYISMETGRPQPMPEELIGPIKDKVMLQVK